MIAKYKRSRNQITLRLLKCYPYGTGFLIRTHELYGFDLPSFDVIVKRIKTGMTNMYYVMIMQIGVIFISRTLAIMQILIESKNEHSSCSLALLLMADN